MFIWGMARGARLWQWLLGVAVSAALFAGLWLWRGPIWVGWTIDLVARRGWWTIATELLVPALVGIAGTAVAAAAFATSARATKISEDALIAEHERADRAVRSDLVRRAREWLDESWADSVGATTGAYGAGRTSQQLGDVYVALLFDVEMLTGAEPLRDALVEIQGWLYRLAVSTSDDFPTEVDEHGNSVRSPLTARVFAAFLRDSRIEQYAIESSLAVWARDRVAGEASLRGTVLRLRAANS